MHNAPSLSSSVLRATRLVLHLIYGMAQAIAYPHLDARRQRRILRTWSRQLLSILGVGIQIEGTQPTRSDGACLIVSNQVSWLDSLVLNAIHPSRFITDSNVRDWPLIGWLCRRGGSIFVDRTMRKDTGPVSRRIEALFEQGCCITLFPEGHATDGRQVGHFHSALIQPAIDSGARLCPIALRYLGIDGRPSNGAAFVGDITLIRSAWIILRSPRFNALLAFTPTLSTTGENRRVLARTAQQAIAQRIEKSTASTQPHTAPAHSVLFGT